jgi:hypothetical protein
MPLVAPVMRAVVVIYASLSRSIRRRDTVGLRKDDIGACVE